VRAVAAVDLVQSCVSLALLLILLLLVGTGVHGAVSAYLVAAVVALVTTVVVLRPSPAWLAPRWDRTVAGRTLSYGVRNWLSNLFQFAAFRFDVVLLNYFTGASAVGAYAVSFRLAEALWLLPGAAGTVVLSRASSAAGSHRGGEAARAFWMVLVVGAAAAGALALVGRPLIELVFTRRFLPAYRPLVGLLPGVVLFGSSSVLGNELFGRGRPGLNAAAAAVSLVAVVGLDLLLVPDHGAMGAAVASSIAYTLNFVVTVVLYLRESRLGLPAFFRAAVFWAGA
jgi:O-antigen/teichoic acid export membrane protein